MGYKYLKYFNMENRRTQIQMRKLSQNIKRALLIGALAMGGFLVKASNATLDPGTKPNATIDTRAIDSNFHIFLLIGQSNMAGRAPLDSLSGTTYPDIYMLDKENHWVPTKDPLHFDKPGVAGIGPGLSFAREMLRKAPKGTKIGLIPSAWGGSPIKVWQPDSVYLHHKPYDEAIARTRIAMQSGVLTGILWHQGESDNTARKAAVYMQQLQQLVGRLRSEFKNGQLPFVAGEVGHFKAQDYINPVLDSIKVVIPFSGIVSAEGLKDKGDKTHFNTESARELGRRYAVVMDSLINHN